jgi:hypothetical protein
LEEHPDLSKLLLGTEARHPALVQAHAGSLACLGLEVFLDWEAPQPGLLVRKHWALPFVNVLSDSTTLLGTQVKCSRHHSLVWAIAHYLVVRLVWAMARLAVLASWDLFSQPRCKSKCDRMSTMSTTALRTVTVNKA